MCAHLPRALVFPNTIQVCARHSVRLLYAPLHVEGISLTVCYVTLCGYPPSTGKSVCYHKDVLAACKNYGASVQHDRGCAAYANGWTSFARSYEPCDAQECENLCNDMHYQELGGQNTTCKQGCARYQSYLGQFYRFCVRTTEK